MQEVVGENQALQKIELELKRKLALAEGGIAWFEMQPGGSLEDAKRLQAEYTAEINEIAAKRSALLQRLLSTSFGGE